MSTGLWRPKSLEDLPNELLREVVRFVGEQSYLPRRFRVLHNLSLVSRRLRTFAFPLLERHVTFMSSRRFLRVADYWEGAKTTHGFEHEGLVRSINIGNPVSQKPSTGDLLSWGNCIHRSPFRNLTSFACLDASANSNVLDRLSQSSSLTFLTLVWSGLRELDLEKFKALQELRVYIEGPMAWSIHSPIRVPHGSLHSLTKLVVHDTKLCRWSKDIFCGNLYMFPYLRVLRLDECSASPRELFSFIQMHSYLMEVSVSTNEDYRAIRLEMLKKLIEGTGTWTDEAYEDAITDGEVNEDISSPCVIVDEDEGYQLHYKDEFPDTHVHFDMFAFTRTPISEAATSWRSPKGSVQPRYRTTGLAFRIMDQESWQARGLSVAYVPDILSLARDHFPEVEELRVSSDTPCWEGNFVTFMRKVATHARDLKHLRRLSISWTIPDEWTWEGPLLPLLFEDNFLQLDAVVPPTERCSDPTDSDHDSDDDDDWVGKGHSLDELRGLYVDEFVDNLIHELRDIHGTEGVDTRDDSLYIRTWEAHNEPRVAKAMRRIAESCPTLERIDWYPTGMDSTAETTRWRWTVHRNSDGGVRLMSGNLTWKGCTRDPAAAMHILLGEELEYEETVHRRHW